MANPDSIRRREQERAARAREKEQNRTDDFHETLAAPVPNHTYRSEIDATEDHATTAEQVVRVVATVLDALLALRFLVSLFSSDRANGLVNFFYSLTNWLVSPFQALFGNPPANGSGFFDWPALAAIVIISALAALINRLIRPRRDY